MQTPASPRRLVRGLPADARLEAPAAGHGHLKVDEDDLTLGPRPAQRVLQRDVAVGHAARVQPQHRAQQREDHGPGLPLPRRPRLGQTAGELEEVPAWNVLGHQKDIAVLIEEGAVASADNMRPATLPMARAMRKDYLGPCRLEATGVGPADCLQPAVPCRRGEVLHDNHLAVMAVDVQPHLATGLLCHRQRALEYKPARVPLLEVLSLRGTVRASGEALLRTV
mmetsp:Transcript_65311/g.181163  ORF Transcript_65311/g.181163 Transcript_65311/m.181163 type:complete len:224 (+) Transcript_65311:170-841(+)